MHVPRAPIPSLSLFFQNKVTQPLDTISPYCFSELLCYFVIPDVQTLSTPIGSRSPLGVWRFAAETGTAQSYTKAQKHGAYPGSAARIVGVFKLHKTPYARTWLRISSTTRTSGCVASMTMPPLGMSSFVRCNRATSSFSSGFPPQSVGSRATRSSSRRYNVSRSPTSRTKTPSNKSMNFEKFLEPPQKKEIALL